MKKTMILFLFLLFLITFNNTKQINASSLNTLSYSSSENLIDRDNCIITNGSISFIKNVYLRYTSRNLYIMFSEDDIENIRQLYINYYNIDNSLILREELTYELENGKFVIVSLVPNNAFSFSLDGGDFRDTAFDEIGFDLMISYSNHSEYIEYIKSDGLFDISLETPSIEISYDNSININTIRSFITCIDGYDGTISEHLSINAEEYLNNSNIPGKYLVELSIEDSNGNSQNGSFFINVYDKISPSIVGPDTLSYSYSDTVTKELVLSRYTITDECDSNPVITMTDFEVNDNELYDLSLTITAKDKYNNISTKVIRLLTIDNVAPIINGESTYTLSYEVNMNASSIVNEYITISDTFDNNPTYTIENDTFSKNSKEVGEYSFTIVAKDSSNNTSNKVISINVVDTIKPVIFISSYQIETLDNIVLSRDDINNILLSSRELNNIDNYSVLVLEDEYTGHENEKGTYLYRVLYLLEDGSEVEKALQIIVSNDSYTYSKATTSSLRNKIVVIVSSVLLSTATLLSLTFIIIKSRKRGAKQ